MTRLLVSLVVAALTYSVHFARAYQSTVTPHVAYSDHCVSYVPEAVSTQRQPSVSPLAGFHRGYYVKNVEVGQGSVGSSERAPNGIRFTTIHVHETEHEGVLYVKAEMVTWLPSENYLREEGFGPKASEHAKFPPGSRVVFRMEGFWSESSRRLCMVGSSSSKRRHLVNTRAVFKLNNVGRSANITSLFTGTLTSLNSLDDNGHFDELRILLFPMMNYKYVLDHGSSSGHDQINLQHGLSPGENMFCPLLRRIGRVFNVEYDPHCEAANGCEILKGSTGFSPHLMLIEEITCSETDRKLRVLLSFVNTSSEKFYWHFDLNRMLVGEGQWDEVANQLNIVACRFTTTHGSASAVRTEDCNTKIDIVFPAVWSIRNSNSMIGRIWRIKTRDDPGYSRKTLLRSGHSRFSDFPQLRYEYTEAKRVHKSCLSGIAEKEKQMYPNWTSPDLRFQMKVKNSQGRVAFGHSDPLFIDDQIFGLNGISIDRSRLQSRDDGDDFVTEKGMFNISYSLGFPRQIMGESGAMDGITQSTWAANELDITAEGVYDMNTGSLCMIGCRRVTSISGEKLQEDDSLDCEILVRIRFPPVNSVRKKNYINGTIESTRAKSDPLYFGILSVSSDMIYIEDARQAIWITDTVFLLSLASDTFVVLFVIKQIRWAKRNPKAIGSTSLFMLVILTLDHMTQIVFSVKWWIPGHENLQDILLNSIRLLGPSEVIVMTVATLAFLIHLRLLQLHWTVKVTRPAEKKMLVVLLPLYVTGALLAVVRSWGVPRPIYVGLRYYGRLVRDCFLVPQILLNVVADSKQMALSSYFYIGISVVHLLPHLQDIHRARLYYPSEQFLEFYMIDLPEEHVLFYKMIAREIASSLGIMGLVVITHWQQRFGGRCVIPERFRNQERMEDEELDWT